MTDPTSNPSSNHGAALRPGDHVEPYVIKQQIGSGGQSVVYKAVDDLLGKKVAIKQFLFNAEQNEAQLRERIMTEARLHQKAAEADPARLVQVLDVVDSPNGLLLINEYISGPSLEQILAQNTLPMNLKQALGIIAATAQALNSIHKQGIIHLDLKPANILMPRTGGLKISDFGLATDIDNQTSPTSGTVRYMSPELLENKKVDGRADLYALGMMAYEMIAGREKFDEAFKLILRDQRNQAVRWVKWHTNPKTKAPPLTDLLPDIPQPISDLVQRLMEKDPNQRVGSAKDLISAIKRHFDGKDTGPAADDFGPPEEVPAQATTPGDTTALPTKGKAMKIGIITAVVVILAAAGVGLFMMNQSRAERQRVLNAARQTLDDAMQAYRDEKYEVAMNMFDQIANDQNQQVQAAFGKRAQAGALFARGHIKFDQKQYDDAIRAYTEAADLGDDYRNNARTLIDETQQAKAFAQTVEQIETLIDEHSFGQARRELDEWRDLAASDEEHQALRSLGARLEDQLARWRVQELIREANDLLRTGNRDEAIKLLQSGPQKLEVTEFLNRLESEHTADKALALAQAALDRGDPESAIQHYEEAIEALPNDQSLKDKLTKLRSSWLVEEGLRMLAQGNTFGADQMFTEALGYDPDNKQARDALARIASSNRRDAFIEAGDTAAANGDYDTALRQYENALQLGTDNPLSDKVTGIRVQILLKQARASLETGDIDKANELVIQASQLEPNNTDVAAVRNEVEVRGEYIRHLNAGDAARNRSAFGEAKRHYLRAKEAMDTPQVRSRLDEAEFDHLLAQARNYIAAGEYASARAQLSIAAEIRTTDEVRELLEQVQAAENGSTP